MTPAFTHAALTGDQDREKSIAESFAELKRQVTRLFRIPFAAARILQDSLLHDVAKMFAPPVLLLLRAVGTFGASGPRSGEFQLDQSAEDHADGRLDHR